MEVNFFTGNLGEAAALILNGFAVQQIRLKPIVYGSPPGKRFSQIGFLESMERRQISEKYWLGQLLVDPLAMYNAINDLKKQRWLVEQESTDTNLTNLKY